VIGASRGKLCNFAKLCLRADCAPIIEKSNKLNLEMIKIYFTNLTIIFNILHIGGYFINVYNNIQTNKLSFYLLA